jgi:hypothetical protein
MAGQGPSAGIRTWILGCLLLLPVALASACDTGDQVPGAATEAPSNQPAPQPTAERSRPQPYLSQVPCPATRPQRRPRRPPPPNSLNEEWLDRLCGLTLDWPEQVRLDIGGGEAARLSFTETWVHHFPGLVDSNSPAFWEGDVLTLFSSVFWPTRSQGPGVEALRTAADVEISGLHGGGGYWLEAVWKEETTGLLYGWYHREPDDLECLTAPVIGALISEDGGTSWQDQGIVLQNPYPIDCSYENGYFSGGNGDFSVILDQDRRYFYFLYSNYAGPLEEQGIGIARSAFADRGQPGTAYKFKGTNWREPGDGGSTTPLFPAATTWKGPVVDAYWGPSVHWNSLLSRYVALINRTVGTYWEQEGVYISFSRDLVEWTEPVRLLGANNWYPQVIGLAPGESDTLAGQTARVYISGMSALVLSFEKEP